MKKRQLLSIEDRTEWVEKWRSSGLSGARFAARHGLNESTLYRWSQRIKRRGSSEADVQRAPVPEFTEVRLRGEGTRDGSIEITLGGNRVLKLSGKVDRDQLRVVLETLASC